MLQHVLHVIVSLDTAENQSLKVQGNLREPSVVANQEDIPTGDYAGIHPLPNALDPQAEMNSITEMVSKHHPLPDALDPQDTRPPAKVLY